MINGANIHIIADTDKILTVFIEKTDVFYKNKSAQQLSDKSLRGYN